MIPYNDALKILRQSGQNQQLETETTPLDALIGRVAATNITAPICIQPFDNSAMDGFTCHASNLNLASEENPITLSQRIHIAAGDTPCDTPLPQGQCDEIMTGAPMPKGANTVIPIENTSRNGNNISFIAPSPIGKHIRKAGEDFQKGTNILNRGTVFGLRHILPLASLGISNAITYKKPRIAIFSTGDELITNLDTPLKAGQIYDSNKPNMRGFLKAIGADCVIDGTIADNAKAFAKQLEELKNLNLDAIITSGAVSKGTHDFIPESLKKAGATTHFHKAKVRPGKPTLFAEFISDTQKNTAFFGLAGNPIATAMGLRFFFWPWLESRYNIPPEQPLCLKFAGKDKPKPPFHFFYKANLITESKKTTKIGILQGQQSFKTSPFLNMTGWASLPESCTTIKSGTIIDYYPIIPPIFTS